jgi:hypothetical protein
MNKQRRAASPSSPAAKRKVHLVMGEFKRGQLHSGSQRGPQVQNRKQAIAIALNSARREG